MALQLTVDQWQEVDAAYKANAVPPHGSSAWINNAGYRPDMYSAMPLYRSFAEALPMFQSEYDNELIEILTGQNATEGANAEAWCADGPTAGYLKTCKQAYSFGHILVNTKPINIQESISRKNRADTNRMLNNAIQTLSKFTPSIVNQNNINLPYSKVMIELGNQLGQSITKVNVVGSTANTGANAQFGFKKEWNGLTQLIKTGHVDQDTQVACPAADSKVIDALNVTLGAATYSLIANMIRTIRMTADNVMMAGTQWALIVHPYLLHPLLDTVACNYASTRCSMTDANGLRQDVTTTRSLLDSMMTQMYIPVDGINYPLIADWGVAITDNVAFGTWTSGIYFVPMSWNGQALTYMEFLPQDNAAAAQILGESRNLRVLNNGLYLLGENTNTDAFCISWKLAAQARMILRTPFLAGRIDNVDFAKVEDFPSPFIGDTYYRDGGQYIRS